MGRERLLPAGLNVDPHPPSGANGKCTAGGAVIQALARDFVDGRAEAATKAVKRLLAKSHNFSLDLAALRAPGSAAYSMYLRCCSAVAVAVAGISRSSRNLGCLAFNGISFGI